MSESSTTTNHKVIRSWAEARGGKPSRVAGQGDVGILRIDFDPPETDLEPISWDDFFAVFEDRKLAFLHQDLTADGRTSRFNKFVDR